MLDFGFWFVVSEWPAVECGSGELMEDCCTSLPYSSSLSSSSFSLSFSLCCFAVGLVRFVVVRFFFFSAVRLWRVTTTTTTLARRTFFTVFLLFHVAIFFFFLERVHFGDDVALLRLLPVLFRLRVLAAAPRLRLWKGGGDSMECSDGSPLPTGRVDKSE